MPVKPTLASSLSSRSKEMDGKTSDGVSSCGVGSRFDKVNEEVVDGGWIIH